MYTFIRALCIDWYALREYNETSGFKTKRRHVLIIPTAKSQLEFMPTKVGKLWIQKP